MDCDEARARMQEIQRIMERATLCTLLPGTAAVAGGLLVLTVKFLIGAEPRPEEIRYIVPVWMMLYGTGVYTAGLFSIRPPRVLGLAFLVMGVVALAAFPNYGVVSAALSFGLLHIVFGFYILRRQRQDRGQ